MARKLPTKTSKKSPNQAEDDSNLHYKSPIGIDRKELEKMVEYLKNEDVEFHHNDFNKRFTHMSAAYAPTFQTITLFIRLAKRSKRNFNTDSMSVVQTIADQVFLKPPELLRKIKTYRLVKPSKPGGLEPYGFRFQFAKKKDKASGKLVAVAPEVENVVLGLKITCIMLKRQAKGTSSATFLKVGRKRESKLDQMTFELVDGQEDESTSANEDDNEQEMPTKNDNGQNLVKSKNHHTVPLIRCHKLSSFDKRIFTSLELRFIAFSATSFMFSTVLGILAPTVVNVDSKIPEPDHDAYLNFSYRITSNCEERREFLRIWTNMFLLYPSKAAICNDRDRLAYFWKNQEEVTIALDLQDYVNSQVSDGDEALVHQMNQAFKFFRDKRVGKDISLGAKGFSIEDNEHEWWQCLRVNTFRHYLDFDPNSPLKEKLKKIWLEDNPELARKVDNKRKKRKASREANQNQTTKKAPVISNAGQSKGDCTHQILPKSSLEAAPTPVPADLPNTANISTLMQLWKKRLDSTSPRNETSKLPTTVTFQPADHIPTASSLPNLAKHPEIIDRFELALPQDLTRTSVESELLIEEGSLKVHLQLPILNYTWQPT